MKRRLFTFALAALTIGLLGSCSKINERIDDLDKRVYDLENGKIASIDQQIDAINRSIADLETIRTNIQNLKNEQEAQGQDITDLKAADITLEGKINDLKTYVDTELSKYATKDWANATFATLEQHQWTCDTIAKIDARIGALDAKLSQSISGLENSLKQWVNEQLDAYYTAARMDTKLGVMQSEIDALKNSKDSERIDSLATELTKTKAAVDTAKANIRTEYKNAIDVAINKLDGEIRGALLDSIAAVNGRIEALDTRVTTLEGKVLTLEGNVNKLLAMVQSVTIVPAYSDGCVESTKDGVLHLDIIVTPAQAVATITKDCLKVMVNEVKTKAVDLDTVAVTKFKVDAAKGTITARADISSNLPVASGKALTIAVNVRNGISDYTTEFYPVTLSSNVTVKDETDTTKVTIKADADFPEFTMGTITVASGFTDSKPTTITVEGIGNITFDKEATAKIKSNAQSEGATNVFFKVEDVTTTKPVTNADVVLEVTMKTVDENGIEVFSKGKEAGEVTIEIPVGEDVSYVKNVTLVDENDNPIQGGVVPGSEKIENGKLIFKVNHFSKYAIDYVTKADFVKVTGVSLNVNTLSLNAGGSHTLIATITPEDATNKNVTWSSSNESVATVDNDGKVTAVAAGTATITATTVDGNKTATCEVTVTVPVTGVSLNVNTLSLNAGGSYTLIATITPEDATNKNVTWSSSNESVATVDNYGKVTAVAAGTATITVTTVDGSKTATCEVTVTVPVTGVSLNVNTLSLNVYDSHTLIATITPEDATNKNVTWSSSNESVATVDNDDKVTAVAAGTATITATTVDGSKTATCTVTVIPFVDLGVKTATGKPLYWAECNLGASNPEDPGYYYMWGATALMYSAVDYTKNAGAFTFVTENPYGDNYKNTWDASKGFAWNNAPFTDGVYNNTNNKKVFTKYTTSNVYAKSGAPDNLTTLNHEDDAATAKNASWRMPTIDDFKSLVANCVLVWTSDYNITGNAGYIVYKAKNDADKGKANMNGTWKMWDAANSKYNPNTGSEPTGYSTSDIHIFLPAAGIGSEAKLNNYSIGGVYWSSSLATSDNLAFALTVMSGGIQISGGQRQYGYSIRPVTE